MPVIDTVPPPVPPRLAPYVIFTTDPAGDPRFSSKRLANRQHAELLLAEIRQKGRAA